MKYLKFLWVISIVFAVTYMFAEGKGYKKGYKRGVRVTTINCKNGFVK